MDKFEFTISLSPEVNSCPNADTAPHCENNDAATAYGYADLTTSSASTAVLSLFVLIASLLSVMF